jgi:acetyl-CoA carboxylase biotin carboxyl carrier protein
MIDIRKLKELVRLMVAHNLTELDLRDKQEQVTLRREGLAQSPQVVNYHSMPGHAAASMYAPGASGADGDVAVALEQKPQPLDDVPGTIRIESPMVGTFYASPDPDSPPFVTVGSKIGPGTTVCLIEAMKIFNEIKAERPGTIARVLVSNGDAVEFGEPLFLMKPD